MALFSSKGQHQANKDDIYDARFSQAVNKAFLEELKGFPFKKAKRLLPFEEVREKFELWFVDDLGVQSVRLDSIIGSQGRYREFTRHFFPLEERMRSRWKNIDRALSSRERIPPVELYKVGEAYFVKDGHHRISVSRSQNKHFIDAKVYAYECDISLDRDTDLEKLAILETYHTFLKTTGLKKARNADLMLSRIGGYPILMQHIQTHQHYLEQKKARPVSVEEAALSWYDAIYTPFVEVIKKHDIMHHFPHRTHTDFYIWIIQYKEKVSAKNLEDLPPYEAETIVGEYAGKFTKPARRVLGAIKRALGLVRY